MKKVVYRSGEPLRHPKAKANPTFPQWPEGVPFQSVL
jgi:hypothetical protein